jgi:DNA polymerase III sliding clamp (beta) subunit (PCNA family)
MGNNDTKGLYIGKSHAEGGIPAVNIDSGQLLEIEGFEYKICNSAYNSSEVLTYTNKTNKEILDDIHDNFACKFDKNEVSNGDFIICKVVVQDPKKHTRKGNVRDILDQMQSEKSCNVSVGSRVLKDGGLIAPNGKPSNLTPQQYKLVRAKAFKSWFGDWENDPENSSKVVDENGEPFIVWHGTDNKFTEFKNTNNRIVGHYFSSDLENSKTYGENILNAFLNIKNPFIVESKGMRFTDDIPVNVLAKYPNESPYETKINLAIDDIVYMVKNGKRKNQFIEIPNSEKYDGVIFKNIIDPQLTSRREVPQDTIVAFYPNQIKLADGTNTTFDGDNPDIRFEKGGTTTSLSDEQKDILKEWGELVNMTEKELEDFIKTKEGREAGMSVSDAKELGISSGRTSAKWILRMKETSPTNWTPTMWKWAKKQINFIKRMSGNKGDLFDENGNKTRKHTSLLLWGHNPKKMALGGNIDNPKIITNEPRRNSPVSIHKTRPKRQNNTRLRHGVVIHEIQHLLQEFESLAKGASIKEEIEFIRRGQSGNEILNDEDVIHRAKKILNEVRRTKSAIYGYSEEIEYNRQLFGVLLHEIQHYIQEVEGLAKGFNGDEKFKEVDISTGGRFKQDKLNNTNNRPNRIALISETEKRQKRALLQEVQYTTQELEDMANGTPIDSKSHKLNSNNKDVYYYVTGKEIEVLRPCFHIGTKEATEKRAEHLGYGDNAIMYKVEFVRPPKYKVVSDRAANLYASCRKGIAINDDASIEEIKEIGNIVKNGFTALKYKNEIEGGDSYLIIDPTIVKIERFMENGGGIKSKRFDFPETMPKNVRDIISNWEFVSKSPYSESYYNCEGKDWNNTPDGCIRISDHWNFTTIHNYKDILGDLQRDYQSHAKTNKETNDNLYWTMAKYDAESKTYIVLEEFPFSEPFFSKLKKEKDFTNNIRKSMLNISEWRDNISEKNIGDIVLLSSDASYLKTFSNPYPMNDEIYEITSLKTSSSSSEYITIRTLSPFGSPLLAKKNNLFSYEILKTNNAIPDNVEEEIKSLNYMMVYDGKMFFISKKRIINELFYEYRGNLDSLPKYIQDINNKREALSSEDYDAYVEDIKDSVFNKIIKAYLNSNSGITEIKESKIQDYINRNVKMENGGQITSPKIHCRNCDWSWNVKDGGHDLYVCHKCGFDNESLENKKQLITFTKNNDYEKGSKIRVNRVENQGFGEKETERTLTEKANKLRERIQEAQLDAEKRTPLLLDINDLIYNFCISNNIWFEDTSDLGVFLCSGNENDVFLNDNNLIVNKINNLMNVGDILSLFDKIDLHNELFPETKYIFKGFYGYVFSNSIALSPIFSQLYISDAEYCPVLKIDEYMKNQGFEKVKEFTYTKNNITVSDVRPRNVLIQKDSSVYVIDAEFKRKNIMEQGGQVTNQDIMGTQLNLLSKNEDILGENLFSQAPTRKKFAYGGVISDVQKWDDVPNEWRNLKDTKPVKFEPSPTDKGFQKIFKPFIGDDELRPVMSGVYFDEDGIVGTDAHKLLVIPYDGDKRGIFAITNSKSADKKIGEEIDGKYPNYKAVIPKNPIQHKITVNKLVQFLQAAMNYTNTITRQVRIVVDKDNSFGVNAKNMIIALNSMLELGYKEVYISYDSPSRAIVITPNKDYDPYNLTEPLALVMPVMILEDDINDKVSALDIDYNKSLFVNFDLSKNEIINGDGSVAQFKMEYGKGVLFNEDDISLINKFISKKSSLLILENLVVKNGYLMATDLESSVKIKQSKAKDGIYSILNKVPYIDTNQELDDFPKFPSFDGAEKLFSIDKEFLKFIIDRAVDYVGNDIFRPAMTGVNISNSNGKITLACTTSYILLRYDITPYCSNITKNDFNILFVPKPIKNMLMYSDSDSIEISKKDNYYLFNDTNKIEVSVRVIDAVFPNYNQIIPSEHTQSFKLDVSDLKNALSSSEISDFKNQVKSKYVSSTISFSIDKRNENKLDFYVNLEAKNGGDEVKMSEKIGETELKKSNQSGEIDQNCIVIMGMAHEGHLLHINPDLLSNALRFGKAKELDFVFGGRPYTYIIQGDFMKYEQGSKKNIVKKAVKTSRDPLESLINIMNNKINNQGYSLKQLYDEVIKMQGTVDGALVFSEFIKRQKEAGNTKLMDEFKKTSFVENINPQPPQDNQNLEKVLRGLKLLEQTDEMKKVIRGLEYIMKMGDSPKKMEHGGEIDFTKDILWQIFQQTATTIDKVEDNSYKVVLEKDVTVNEATQLLSNFDNLDLGNGVTVESPFEITDFKNRNGQVELTILSNMTETKMAKGGEVKVPEKIVYFQDYINWLKSKGKNPKYKKIEDGLYEYDKYLNFRYNNLDKAKFKFVTKNNNKFYYRDVKTEDLTNIFKASLTFPNREEAELFALKWGRYSKSGHIVGSGLKDVKVTVFDVTEKDKEWINSYIENINNEKITQETPTKQEDLTKVIRGLKVLLKTSPTKEKQELEKVIRGLELINK